MRIAVTGGTGRLGTYVVRELIDRGGHEVTVLDRVGPPRVPGVRWVQVDLLDLGQVATGLRGSEAVVHLAAIARPGGVPDHVLFGNNLTATYHVLEGAATVGIGRAVLAGSSAVLGWQCTLGGSRTWTRCRPARWSPKRTKS